MNMDDSGPRIAVNQLEKRYQGRTVISGVSMTLGAGDMLALVGANGGGKTTTLRMLAGLLRPDAGNGHVLGRDIRVSGGVGRGEIGYMTQSIALYGELNVAANLHFRASIHGLPDSIIADTIAAYDLGPYAQTRVDRLSGGWARRTHFAATMLNRPSLLLLDEPTAGLDAVTRRDMWGWLGALADAGHTIVISTHDMAEAERCPSILLFDNGTAAGPMAPVELRRRTGTQTLEAALVALAT